MNWKLTIVTFVLTIFQLALAQSFQILDKNCEGNYLIAKVKEIDGTIGYRILDYCPYGCKYGVCLSKKEVPVINVKEIYDVKVCDDNLIFISIKNIGGTKGDISLNVIGEAAEWIRYPQRITLDINETKTIPIVVSVPCNITSGIYPFTLVGSGVINFYAPSAIAVGDNKPIKLPITTTVTPVNPMVGLVAVVTIGIILFIVYRYGVLGKPREEMF